ncbi:MAG: ATP-binding protein [Bacteroidota bacterium]
MIPFENLLSKRLKNLTKGKGKVVPYKVIFYFTLVLIISFTFFSVSLLYQAQKDRFWAEHRRKMEIEITGITSSVYEMESVQRGYLLSRNQQVMEPFDEANKRAFLHIRSAYGLTMDVWSQVEALNRLNSQVLERKILFTRLAAADSLKEPFRSAEIARLVYRGHEIMNQIRRTTTSMVAFEQKLYEERTKSIRTYEATSIGLVTTFGILTAIISVLGYIKLQSDNKHRDRAEQDRRRSADILKQSEMRYRNLNDSSNDAIVITDATGAIISWNNMAQTIFGYSPPEAYSMSTTVIMPDVRVVNRVNDNEEVSRFETTGKTKKGKDIPLEISLSSWQIKNDVFTGVTIRDITEQRKTLEKLDNAIKELQRSNEDLEQFAYVASHDLQEPLRKIQTFSDRFMAKFHSQEGMPGQEYLIPMRNAAERMQTLIQDLLAFSRLTKDNTQQQNVNLNDIVGQVLDDLQLSIEDKKGLVTISDLPTLSKASKMQMHQLFLNLISNALKFSKTDVPARISVMCSITDTKKNTYHEVELNPKLSYYRIEISDNGIGFDNKYLEKIFTIFQRLHGRTEYAGTGIGLAVCKKICKNHKGFITARGEADKGATFILFFPKHK